MLRDDVFNSAPIAILCVLAMIIVIVQPLIFLKRYWKHGKDIGMKESSLQSVAKSSAIFAIVPTLPVLVNYIILIPAFGKYFSWLRLSIMGNAAYETTMADLAATALGYDGMYIEGMDVNTFVIMMFMVTFAIMGGAVLTLVLTKYYESAVHKATKKIGGGKMVGLLTTAMFVGLYSSLCARQITNASKPLNIVAFIVALIVTWICTKVSKKIPGLRQYTFSLSIIAGMLSASIISVLM